MKKNLVMGVAKGYGWYVLEPFVNSFFKNCSSAELVLFVDDISDFTRDKMIRAGVTLKNFPYKIEGIPNNTRWKIFCDFLEVHGDEYEQIFITDTRDVIFQADIFKGFKGFSNWLGCVTEADDIRGSKSGNLINYNWLVSCFGKNEADKIANKKIICCGTVIGSAAEMKIFCRELWKILEHKTGGVFDQAVTNWLVYNGLLPIENLFEIDVDSGEIFTACLVDMQKSIKFQNGMILRGDGGIPAVVHQYERDEDLLWLVDKLYCDKNISFDERFTDPRSLLEQCCSLLLVDKITGATRLFLKIFFEITDFNAYVSQLIEILSIALRKKFSQTVETLELAVQNALNSVEKIADAQLIKLHKQLICLAKNHHAVDLEFRNSFANRLLQIAEENLANGAPEFYCFRCINMIEALDMPSEKKFYLFVAKANRIFGHKDAALAAYKKVLDLS